MSESVPWINYSRDTGWRQELFQPRVPHPLAYDDIGCRHVTAIYTLSTVCFSPYCLFKWVRRRRWGSQGKNASEYTVLVGKTISKGWEAPLQEPVPPGWVPSILGCCSTYPTPLQALASLDTKWMSWKPDSNRGSESPTPNPIFEFQALSWDMPPLNSSNPASKPKLQVAMPYFPHPWNLASETTTNSNF